jgi:hypothetical protein
VRRRRRCAERRRKPPTSSDRAPHLPDGSRAPVRAPNARTEHSTNRVRGAHQARRRALEPALWRVVDRCVVGRGGTGRSVLLERVLIGRRAKCRKRPVGFQSAREPPASLADACDAVSNLCHAAASAVSDTHADLCKCARKVSGGGGSRTRVFRVLSGASPSAADEEVSGHCHSSAVGGGPSLSEVSRRALRPVPAVSRSWLRPGSGRAAGPGGTRC